MAPSPPQPQWPDVPAATSPSSSVRDQLDYLAWVGEACEALGFHGGPELEAWRGRVQRAYAAMVDAMAPGHGDPFPPDVPPAIQPGTWPDVASAGVSGMTVRHQLAAIRVIAAQSRIPRPYPRAAADVAAWTQRVQTAYDALDHGGALVMPASARSVAPAPLASTASPRRTVRSKAASRPASGAVAKAAPGGTAKRGKAKASKPPAKGASNPRTKAASKAKGGRARKPPRKAAPRTSGAAARPSRKAPARRTRPGRSKDR